MDILEELRGLAVTLAASILLAVILRKFICDFPIVKGNSMRDTLKDGERMVVTKIDLWWNPPKRGDIIIGYYPETSRHKGLVVKRVVAIGGDTIGAVSGDLVVNGEIVEESYILKPSRDFIERTVPESHYFVMGDNRPRSDDSRNATIGSLPRKMIKGRVRVVFWPIRLLRIIK